MLKELLKNSPTPGDLLANFTDKLSLERQLTTRRVKGKRRQRLSKPRYILNEPSRYWNFQTFVEQMYQKPANNLIKFGLMTTKSFEEEFGCGETSTYISMDDIKSPKTNGILDRLGIIEVTQRRLVFLEWLENDIEKRDMRTGSSDLESWL